MESSKGYLGGWFKALWVEKSLPILNKNFKKNYFSCPVIQYVTLFYRLLLQMLYGRRILENEEFRKKVSSLLTILIPANSDFQIFMESSKGDGHNDIFPGQLTDFF